MVDIVIFQRHPIGRDYLIASLSHYSVRFPDVTEQDTALYIVAKGLGNQDLTATQPLIL